MRRARRVRPPLRRARLGRPEGRGGARSHRGGLQLSEANAGLAERVSGWLDARLTPDANVPLALALSGGGDSIALLHIAADWARRRGRRVLALTVDHGLHPDSAGWTAFAAEAARDVGADWRGLVWDGDKPTVGVPAAARRARHALIAEAARAAGARVVLMAHTADDVAESEVMRADGVTLGRLRDWSPSPAWPEGRGLMLLRPMLGERREILRGWLTALGQGWIDDPANADPRHARVRARQALAGRPTPLLVEGRAVVGLAERGVRVAEDGVELDRWVEPWVLAAALVAVGGGDRPPRGERLERLTALLGAGEDFAADLAGARVEAAGGAVWLFREAGALARQGAKPTPLEPGVERVWDGRWRIEIDEPDWSVAAARGRMAGLSHADRSSLNSLPPAQRATRPVLIRDDGGAPILAGTAGRAEPLIHQRLALALDTTTHEKDLD